jgi:hypothetical protein
MRHRQWRWLRNSSQSSGGDTGGNGGIRGAGHEAAGGEAMTRRKSEITHDDLKRKRKTDVILSGCMGRFSEGFLYGQAGIFGRPHEVNLLS